MEKKKIANIPCRNIKGVNCVGNPSEYRRIRTRTEEGFRTSQNDSTVNLSSV